MKSSLCKSTILLTLFGLSLTFAQPNYPTESKKSQLIFSDLENFVTALNILETNTDTIQVLNTYYFEKASAGLKEYINRHGLTTEMLKDAIEKSPENYKKIPTFVDGIALFNNKLKKVFIQFQDTVPNAMFAPTYLLVGANRGIAQASQQGQLVTITRIVDNEDKLLKMIVHELAHFQQAKTMGGQQYGALYSQPNNMLGICLREGGAEFITSQVLGSVTQEKSIAYYTENEVTLKQRFLVDLKTQNNSFWLWDSIEQKEYPQLLGYVMGYKIWSSYYKEIGNRDQVINEILNITDANKYIQISNYFID